MMQSIPFPLDDRDHAADALAVIVAMAEELGKTVCIARVLVAHGRAIDLTGLDRGVGLLCAKSLDLPPDAGRSARPHLAALLAESEQLTAALHAAAGRSPGDGLQ